MSIDDAPGIASSRCILHVHHIEGERTQEIRNERLIETWLLASVHRNVYWVVRKKISSEATTISVHDMHRNVSWNSERCPLNISQAQLMCWNACDVMVLAACGPSCAFEVDARDFGHELHWITYRHAEDLGLLSHLDG